MEPTTKATKHTRKPSARPLPNWATLAGASAATGLPKAYLLGLHERGEIHAITGSATRIMDDGSVMFNRLALQQL